jgi:hypothetical protein
MHPRTVTFLHRRELKSVLLYFTFAILLPVSNFSPSLLWASTGLVVFTVIMWVRRKFLS